MKIEAFCTAQNPSLPPFSALTQRGRDDSSLLQQLDGQMDALFGDGTEMTSERYALIRHMQRVAHHYSFELSEESLAGASAWLEQSLAIALWPDGSLRDPAGLVLFRPGSQPDDQASLPVSPEAKIRKGLSERRLQAQSIAVPSHLPTVADEHQVLLRSPEDVARRTLALFLVALRAESVGAGDPIGLADMQERQPVGWASLTPQEQDFINDPAPPEELVMEMSWRYEALQLLFWALGRSQLAPPSETCDVGELVGLLLEVEESLFLAQASLRPTPILLDALDLHYRAHWAIRQADMTGEEIPGGLDPGVVFERHHALNWLTRFEEAPWDDVDTPT